MAKFKSALKKAGQTIRRIIEGIGTMKLGTWIRTVALFVSIALEICNAAGVKITAAPEAAEQGAILAFAAIAALVSWWKNNSVTKAAQAADQVLAELKAKDEKRLAR